MKLAVCLEEASFFSARCWVLKVMQKGLHHTCYPQNYTLIGRQEQHSFIHTYIQRTIIECLLYTGYLRNHTSGFQALSSGPRAEIEEWSYGKGSQIHKYHKYCLQLFIRFLFMLSFDKYLLSVYKHAWWDNVSVVSVFSQSIWMQPWLIKYGDI